MKRPIAPTLLLVLALLAALVGPGAPPASAAAPAYTITDLGTIWDFDARAINNAGQVAGVANERYAVRWQNGTLTPLTTDPTVPNSGGYGINDRGDVVGEANFAYQGYTNRPTPFFWDASTGAMRDLGNLSEIGIGLAYDVNGARRVVGQARNSGGWDRAFLWTADGGMVDLGTLLGDDTGDAMAFGINAAGQVVGESQVEPSAGIHAVLWHHGLLIDLGTLAGPGSDWYSFAFGINDAGQVVGESDTADGGSAAFLWTPSSPNAATGVMTALAMPPDAGYIGARKINNAGQVIGRASLPPPPGEEGSPYSPVLWQGDAVYALNALIPAGSGWRLREARDINDAGQIVGVGVLNGQDHSFLLTPVEAVNTPAGTNVTVRPVDQATGTAPVTLTFDDVTRPGATTLTTGGTGPAMPAGFQLGDPPTYYELATTASFSGTVLACIDYSGVAYADPAALRLLHYVDGAWVDETVSNDTIARVICARVASFSPFAVAQRVSPTDAAPPVIECGAPDGLWHPGDVSIACTAQDSGSGLADPADASFALATAVPEGTETADAATASRPVCDRAGNCATAGPIHGNKVDKKPPTIAIVVPAADAVYTLNQPVVASYTCADGGSTVASCAGSVADGGPLDTALVGAKAFAVTATDAVGNSASQAVTYTVGYNICLLYDPTRAVRSGSVLPLTVQLCDAAGVNRSAADIVVTAQGVVLVSTEAPGPLEDAGNANPDDNFRYNSAGGYTYNLSTKGLGMGTYALRFTVGGDPHVYTALFQVR